MIYENFFFFQKENENFYQCWERFKDLLTLADIMAMKVGAPLILSMRV
jgi:hypothetical protein